MKVEFILVSDRKSYAAREPMPHLSNETLFGKGEQHATTVRNRQGRRSEKDRETMTLEPFDTVIFTLGMLSAPEPAIEKAVADVEVIGDAEKVLDIHMAIYAGYALALK